MEIEPKSESQETLDTQPAGEVVGAALDHTVASGGPARPARGGLPLDDWTISVYMQELVNQAEAAQLAAEDFNDALRASPPKTSRAFAAVQALLAAGAMVSKMLWPQPPTTNPDGTPLND